MINCTSYQEQTTIISMKGVLITARPHPKKREGRSVAAWLFAACRTFLHTPQRGVINLSIGLPVCGIIAIWYCIKGKFWANGRAICAGRESSFWRKFLKILIREAELDHTKRV